MATVLYFHGFASSPASAKIAALRPLLAPHGIELDAPDLNAPSFEKLDFDAMVARALEHARRTPPRAIVGSSLGALVALAVARRWRTGNPACPDESLPDESFRTGRIACPPLVLIAPALGVADRWRTKLPAGDPIMVYHYALDADAPIHRAFFEQMADLHIDNDPPPSPVTVIMGRQDETVPFADVWRTWEQWRASGKIAPGSNFIDLEGDHALVAHADIIRDAIINAAQSQSPLPATRGEGQGEGQKK
ncbi:MAG TPA: YqiA/YcfP family alpha/beta fold hydrolase [Thermoanaerobaculia bacterium]|nr:YqiA/YcfP family alpha/beta fold hydrolase [Thermoanaerobaculia bacterium]